MAEVDTPIDAYTCEDVRVLTDDGALIYSGPKYHRCLRPECLLLVTKGMIKASGGCWCGNRRLGVALKVTTREAVRLKQGYYPLATWEAELIQPDLPHGTQAGWGKAEWEAQYA
jgi:hypothetical protein